MARFLGDQTGARNGAGRPTGTDQSRSRLRDVNGLLLHGSACGCVPCRLRNHREGRCPRWRRRPCARPVATGGTRPAIYRPARCCRPFPRRRARDRRTARHDHREVQVWPGRAAARADIADQVAFVNPAARAHANGEMRHVGVKRLEIIGVADLHRAAVVEVPALMIDHAVGRGIDRLADLALVVDAVVEAAAGRAAVVAARAERRGDARIGLGLGQGRAAEAACPARRTSLRAGSGGANHQKDCLL